MSRMRPDLSGMRPDPPRVRPDLPRMRAHLNGMKPARCGLTQAMADGYASQPVSAYSWATRPRKPAPAAAMRPMVLPNGIRGFRNSATYGPERSQNPARMGVRDFASCRVVPPVRSRVPSNTVGGEGR